MVGVRTLLDHYRKDRVKSDKKVQDTGAALERTKKALDSANDELVSVKEAAEAARQASAEVSANAEGLRKRNEELEAEMAKLRADQADELKKADALGYDASQREMRADCKAEMDELSGMIHYQSYGEGYKKGHRESYALTEANVPEISRVRIQWQIVSIRRTRWEGLKTPVAVLRTLVQGRPATSGGQTPRRSPTIQTQQTPPTQQTPQIQPAVNQG